MADYTLKTIDELEAVFGGSFKRARAELGVRSFGMQVIEMPPGADEYPEHDHADGGQEEVYMVLRGSAEIDIDSETVRLDPETIVRVGPTARRKIRSGPDGVRILALGGTPGQAYEPHPMTELGAPDPMAG